MQCPPVPARRRGGLEVLRGVRRAPGPGLSGRLLSATAKFCLGCAQPSGAITVYPMIGLTWSLVYVLVEYLQPGSYRLATTATLQASGKDLLYFGYVTLATLGYG
jgi:hypothetical protein